MEEWLKVPEAGDSKFFGFWSNFYQFKHGLVYNFISKLQWTPVAIKRCTNSVEMLLRHWLRNISQQTGRRRLKH